MAEYQSRTEKRLAEEKGRKKRKNRPLLKKIMISALVVFLITIIAGTATTVAYIWDAPSLEADDLVFAEGATIYDMNDQEVGRLQGTENRTYRDTSEMPDHLKNAFIAVEDSRFYDHRGIDLHRIGGAIVANVTEGFGAEGASTITQQLVKQAFLSTDQTIKRKVQEQWLALQMERHYSKDEILEMYLNVSYFDSGAWGVGEASIRYFNKEDLSDLTIADSAVLAAIPRRPSYYNPDSNPEAAEQRRNMIISLMEEQALITSDEAQAARDIAIEDQLDFIPANNDHAYQTFIDHVMDEVESIDGVETIDLYAAGFDIYTTLEPDAQEYAEDVVQSDEYIHQYPDDDHFQVGVTLLDTQTGAIRAMVGNREESEAERGWNHATAASGQPGSTVKPILDYGPAIDYLQWSTGEQIVDAPHEYSNGTPIRNYSGNYSGSVSMREALIRSLNIPAVKAMQNVGLDNAQSFAEGLGLTFENFEESYALGGFGEGVSSLDMAGAYASFGNDGIYNEPHSVRKVVFRDGQELELNAESERAMNDYTAYMISDMLKGVVTDPAGTGRRANVDDLPLAGKTGTSNFSPEEQQEYGFPDGAVPDIWFNGYTTRYTAAVWTGYEGKRSTGYLADGEEQQIARDIFRHVMTHVHEGEETEDFTRPDSVCGSGELFVCGAEPTPSEPDDSTNDDHAEESEEESEAPVDEDISEDPVDEAPEEESTEEPDEEEGTDDATEEEEPEEDTEEPTEEDPEQEEPAEEDPEQEESEEPADDPPEDDPDDNNENNEDDGDDGNDGNGDNENDNDSDDNGGEENGNGDDENDEEETED